MLGLLHKALGDAVEEGLIERNPVIRATSRKVQRSRRSQRLTANPLRPEEVSRFLGQVPEWYRDFYTIWFYTGWRSSEIVAIRFGWLDFRRQTVALKRGRMPRFGGLEAEPKTGPREVDCSYAPQIFAALARLRERAKLIGPEDFVFTNPAGQPLSQEWLHDRIWTPTLAACRNPLSWAVLHPRHFHHSGALVGRRPRLGGAGLRNLGRDDFPPLPALDPGIEAWRGRKDLSDSSSRSCLSRFSKSVPKTVPRNRRNGRSLGNLWRNAGGEGGI